MFRLFKISAVLAAAWVTPARAGPPYVTDDPEPTDTGHYEIYAFANGVAARDGSGGESGIDFNYGAAPDLQLTAVLPLAYDSPRIGAGSVGLGNIELAAKYRFAHQADIGWDISFFPRVFLPAGAPRFGARHVSLLLPIWVGRDWDSGWSTFGGGGCELNRGGDGQDFCVVGWAVTRQIRPGLQLGVEIYHQTADTVGGRASTGIGAGALYDVSERLHLLASFGPGIQNAGETDRISWYAAMLFTL